MFSTQQTYEDLEAKYEIEETPGSILMRVHVPDGFAREHIGAKVEHEFSRVRVHGEKSLGNNRRVRFNAQYEVPEHCDITKIKGKFDGKIVTITIPTIPGKVPKQKPQPTQQEAQPTQQEAQETEAKPPEEENQSTLPQSTTESEEEDDHETETSTPPKDTQEESMHQNGLEGTPRNATITKVESEKEKQVEETSTPPKDTQEESKPQKGQEGIPTKDTITKVESKKQVGEETLAPIEDKQEESMPQKVQKQETIPTNAKLQGEEKFEGEIDENEKKQKVTEKKETEEHSNKETLESGKVHEEKDVVDDSLKKESKEESKGLDKFEGEKAREINGKIGSDDDVEKKSDNKKVIPESTTRTRIKEVAASASQAISSLAKRFKNEEDKQRIIYMGAAVIVVALGVYATYKLRSRRP